MPTHVLFELHFQPGKAEVVKPGFTGGMLDETRAYDGCISVQVGQDQADADRIVFVEQWESRAHHEAYFAWRQSSGALDALGSMLASPPSTRYLDDLGG